MKTKQSLRNKFILYFSPLLLGIILFGFYYIFILSGIHKQLSQLYQDVTPNAVAMLELKDLLTTLEAGIKEKRIDSKQVGQKIAQLKKLVASHKDHEASLKEVDKTSHEMLHKAIRTMSLSDYVVKQSVSGWQDADLENVSTIIHQELLALGPIIDQHLEIHLKELARAEAYVSKKYQSVRVFVGFSVALMFLLVIIICAAMMRMVLDPVKALQKGAREFGEGNLEYNLVVSSGDELESLAKEFQEMAAKLKASHAELDKKVQERTTDLSIANEDLRREIAERKEAQREQLKAEEQVHVLSQELLKIQEAERQQISLDLHDNVAQELTSLKVAGEEILATLNADDTGLHQKIQEWGKQLGRCVKTVRELSYNLRPPGLEQIGLPGTVADYCRNYSKRTGIKVNFSTAGIEKLSLDYNYAINIYRLLQEALNNVHKHAKAQTVEIKLTASHPDIIVSVEDDGKGFDLDSDYKKALQGKRLGVLGMQERVRMLNGSFKIQSEPQQGTKIYIKIPWSSSNDSA